VALLGDARTTAFRLVNGAGDSLDGLTVDRFEDVLVASLYDDLEPGDETALLETLAHAFEPRAIYLKRRPKEARVAANAQRDQLAPDAPSWGERVDELAVVEGGVQYLIRPGGDLSVGLFLDMREPRAWLRHNVAGRTVLNCFAYTCGFGLVGSLGGATRAVNLDLSRRVLEWGEQNYRTNTIEPKRFDFVSGDVFDWLTRFARRGDTFDCVVLDPPSFATSKHTRFSAASNYDELVSLAVRVLAPDGLLLACCNHARLERRAFLGAVRRGVERAGRGYNLIASLGQSDTDFPVPGHAEPPLKVFALEVA
jgi:23S rRNA (cytosine1962-C5)-methyltransferase